MKPSRFGTFANELTQDGDTNEYGLIIWLGTTDKDEAEKLADEVTEVWNQNTEPSVKQ